MKFEELQHHLNVVLKYGHRNGEPISILPVAQRRFEAGKHFYRVRNEPELQTEADCWCRPSAGAPPGRFHMPATTVLYTSLDTPKVALDEMEVGVGQTVSLICYRASRAFTTTLIGAMAPSATRGLNAAQSLKLELLVDFVNDQICHEVTRGSDHRYKISNILAQGHASVLPRGSGWSYPSVMRGGPHDTNVCFLEHRAKTVLDLLGVVEATPLQKLNADWLLRLDRVATLDARGALQYSPGDDAKWRSLVPGLRGFSAGPIQER